MHLFPETLGNMAMVSEFLKQAWFMDNQEQECIVSIINFWEHHVYFPVLLQAV